jgi:hypothetical protein
MSTNDQRIPGKWKAFTKGMGDTEIVAENGRAVCNCTFEDALDGATFQTNARLIAAAPALLEALKDLYGSFQHDGNGRTKGNQAKTDIIIFNDDVKIALNVARVAIEKAEREV